jgi:hypothetical protein
MKFCYKILNNPTAYTGRELRSGWVGEKTGLSGDASAGFVGPCRVATDDLVDLDDRRAGATIESALMAHVVIEHPGCDIRTCVLRQRLLVCILCEILSERGIDQTRDGDDVYVEARKLTVSIAAPSAGSSLIHLGINVNPEGAPVPAVGLEKLRINENELLDELLKRYGRELEAAAHAENKVRTVE